MNDRPRQSNAQRGKSWPVPATPRTPAGYAGVDASFMGLSDGLFTVFLRSNSGGSAGIVAEISSAVGNAEPAPPVLVDVPAALAIVIPARDVKIKLYALQRDGAPPVAADTIDTMALPVQSYTRTDATLLGDRVAIEQAAGERPIGGLVVARSAVAVAFAFAFDGIDALLPARGAPVIVTQRSDAGAIVKETELVAGVDDAPVPLHPMASRVFLTNATAPTMHVAPIWQVRI